MWFAVLFWILSIQIQDVSAEIGVKPNFINRLEIQEALTNIKESGPSDTVIVTARATEGSRNITYSILQSAAEFLEIGTVTGAITIKATLDFENRYLRGGLSAMLVATDDEGDVRQFVTGVALVDVNDNAPVFNETYYNFDLFEDTPVGYTITVLNITDADVTNEPLTLECSNKTAEFIEACNMVRIVLKSRSNKNWEGYIILNSPLDYETKTSYSIHLKAYDGLNEKTEQEVFIGVKDINDSPPYFVRAEGSIIPEQEQLGVYIDYVSAVDRDKNGARPIRYELFGDEEALRYFAVDAVSGNITNIAALDYEDPTRTPGQPFTLQIKARELLSSNPELLGNDSVTTATASIKIRVTDINDNCPVFAFANYSVTIREDIGQDAIIPILIGVTDKDTGKRSSFDLDLIDPTSTFQLTSNEGLASASVYLSVINAGSIDYESPVKSYNLQVVATQNGEGIRFLSCSSTASIFIQLEDVNDEAPQFPRQVYNTTVVETAGGGTSLITIKAFDRDSGSFGNDSLRYTLVGSGQSLFQIDPISGVVTVTPCATPGVTPCIDYERKRRYDMAVRVLDSGDLPGTTRLVIDVINVNDNSPEFITSYTRSIREGETRTTDELFIRATDRDGDTVIYSIPPNQREAALWIVDPVSGEITARRPIFYSDLLNPSRENFIFNAMASDGSKDSVIQITINVIDINDKTPIFLPVDYRISIPEDIPGNEFVIQVSVTDADSPTLGNGQVVVSIESGNFGKFKAVANGTADGVTLTNILTADDATFEYNTRSQYILILKGRDKGSPARTGTATVTVDILDINNKSPYFDPPTTSINISESAPIGTPVVTLTAIDKDIDSDLEVFLVDPILAFNPAGQNVNDRRLFENLFTVDKKTHVVSVNSTLDRDIVNFISFTVLVRDVKPAVPQEGRGALYIRILEFNDQAPYFLKPFYNISVPEERPTGSFVGSLQARDEDDQVTSYRLTSNPGLLLSISTTSGVLTVNGRLDYETQHNVTLVAQATDDGSPPLSNSTTILIWIININDNTPIFNETVYTIDLPEHSTKTGVLLGVSASDADEGDFGVVEYSADDPNFRVDQFTGEIFLKPGANLDRESITTYTFQVTAYDSPLNATVRRYTTAPVYVILQDINDNCPEFTQSGGYSDIVIETAEIGDQVLEMFATDKDFETNRRIKFSIDQATAQPPSANDLFSIVSIQSKSANIESGRIEVKNSLRSQAGVYTFTVVASDKNGVNSSVGGYMCSTRVNVTITIQEAINDAPIWILPPSTNFSIDVLESQYRGMLVYDCKARDINRGAAGIVDYFFNVKQNFTAATDEFRINQVTGVIRAEIVYDLEQVGSYVLTVVAKDRGIPSASSETVLIVNVLDVNDNDPEFPMRNGETIPIIFPVNEGDKPGPIGVVSATDKDTDHKNNKIYYKIVAGNDEGYFQLDRVTGVLSLSPSVTNGLDGEVKDRYFMDVLAYNDVNDDSVIRYRRKRSTNPSIVTVIVEVTDSNDTPPKFLKSDYYGCVPLNAPFGQSILKVEAVDQDIKRAPLMGYSKVSETTDGFFAVDPTLGIVRNVKLLYNIDSRVPVVRIRANDSVGSETGPSQIVDTDVKIFVTEASNEVKLLVSQPSADVRYYQDQLIRVMLNASSQDSSVHYVCIREIRDHVNDDGSRSYTSSDVFLSAVYVENGNYKIYDNMRLRDILAAQLTSKFQALYVQSVEVETEDDELSLTEDPVLAIFIIAILLIFLAILLFCLACCLIRKSKKKKMKKLRADQHTRVEVVRQELPPPEVLTSSNPVYDNKGFQHEEEYAVVQKRRPAAEPVSPPIIPVMVPASDLQPVVQVPDLDPETVIITEPIMTEEPPQEMRPPPADFFQPSEPEPIIETVIETEVIPESEEPQIVPGGQSSFEDEIDVEFRDIQGSPSDSPQDSPRNSTSPRRSRSPSPSPQEYRIETDVM